MLGKRYLRASRRQARKRIWAVQRPILPDNPIKRRSSSHRGAAWEGGAHDEGRGMTLRFRLIFATACAVLAIMLGAAYSDKVKADVERQRSDAIARYGGEVVGVVVTKDGLRPGDVVEASDVGMRDWVAELVPEGALTGLNDAVGREVTCPVARNSIMTQTCFESESELAEVPAGFVGVSIPFSDKLGVSRNVARGAKLIAYAVDKDGSKDRKSTRLNSSHGS